MFLLLHWVCYCIPLIASTRMVSNYGYDHLNLGFWSQSAFYYLEVCLNLMMIFTYQMKWKMYRRVANYTKDAKICKLLLFRKATIILDRHFHWLTYCWFQCMKICVHIPRCWYIVLQCIPKPDWEVYIVTLPLRKSGFPLQ